MFGEFACEECDCLPPLRIGGSYSYFILLVSKCLLSIVKVAENLDPVIFGLPDPVLFSPDSEIHCSNGYILYIYVYISYLSRTVE